MIMWLKNPDKLPDGSCVCVGRDAKEHMFQILFCVIYEKHYRDKKPKNMVKYIKKYHPMLYEQFDNDKDLKSFFTYKKKRGPKPKKK